MRMSIRFRIINSQMIESVNAHFTTRMNDIIVIHDNSDVNDFPFFIIKKRQITRLAFFNKTQRFTFSSLL